MHRIMLLLDHKENRRLLEEALTARYEISAPKISKTTSGLLRAVEENVLEDEYDMCIIDGPALDRLWKHVEERKKAELPVFLPFLLVSTRPDITFATRHLWKRIDDIIISPIEKVELHARVEVLLRARRSSSQLLTEREDLAARNRELKKLSREREQLLAQMEATLASVPDALIVYDENRRIVRMNRASRELLGDAISVLTGTRQETTANLTTPEGMRIPPDELPAPRALAGETIRAKLMTLKLPSADTLWLAVSAAPVQSGDEILGAISTVTDITPLRELEEQRETYTHTISHDLRAPLAVIDGRTHLLADEIEQAKLNGELASNLHAIQKATRRMNIMIQDLVDVARLEGGQLALDLESVELTSYISDILERAEPLPAAERLNVDLPRDLPLVHADPERLERVFSNLLSNAFKYSFPGTIVNILARRHGDEVVISIADKGPGIDPDDIPRLFKKFSRAGAKRETEGIGLGLYLCRILVEAHGGRIWVNSEPGRGSTFSFTVPVAVQPRAEP